MSPLFLEWLNAPSSLSWLDIGCGTGALSEAIFNNCNPENLTCIDPSPEFLEMAKKRLSNEIDFAIGTASNIPKASNTFDIVASALALNFFPDLPSAFSEMKRVLKSNGTIAAFVWDYSGRMDFLRHFWDAAREADPNTVKLDEGVRFPICNLDELQNVFQGAGLSDVKTTHLDVQTVFKNFDDYWNPFLGGQGPAPGYVASLKEDLKDSLKNKLRERLPSEGDGSIKLLARALAIRGTYKQ
jgi:SAM-dependent methyltransferase